MSIQALVPAQLRHCGVQQMGVIYPAQDKAALPACCLQGSAKLLANTARCHGFFCKQDGFIVGKLAAETIRQGINLHQLTAVRCHSLVAQQFRRGKNLLGFSAITDKNGIGLVRTALK